MSRLSELTIRCSTKSSCSVQMVVTRPGRPIRPQRPAACVYASAVFGKSKRKTREQCGMSMPRAASPYVAISSRREPSRRLRTAAALAARCCSELSIAGGASSTTPASASAIFSSGLPSLTKMIVAAAGGSAVM